MPRLIDLTHPLTHGQPVFPGDPPVLIEPAATIATHQYNVTRLTIGTHSGTHLDAPSHFIAAGKTVDQIDLSRFHGPASLIDLAPGDMLPPRLPLTLKMFEKYAHLFIPGAKVIYRTGWERTFGQQRFFDDPPSLTLEAAEWIAARRIGLLGMDTPTPSAQWLEVHHALLGNGVEIVLLESLANLELLPPHFVLTAFPLKLAGRDGSPVRAVAEVP